MSEHTESTQADGKSGRAGEKNYRRRGGRYRARRRAVDFLFEAETRDVDPVAIVEDRIALARFEENGVAPVADYTAELVRGTAERLDEIDTAIARYLSEQWELGRLPAVDRAVLRVGAWEILYNPEVDAPISIVDSVEIASEYSTDVAPPYIHAVLDDIAQSVSSDNPMNQPEAQEAPDEPDQSDEAEPGEPGEPRTES